MFENKFRATCFYFDVLSIKFQLIFFNLDKAEECILEVGKVEIFFPASSLYTFTSDRLSNNEERPRGQKYYE